MPFPQAIGLYFLLLLVSASSRWSWSSDFCRFHVGRNSCLHSGGRKWVFLSWWAEPCDVACFGASMWGMSIDELLYILILLVVWVKFSALCAAGSWMVLGLGYKWKPSWEFSLIDILWGQEISSSLLPQTHCSYPRNRSDFWMENQDRASCLLWQ